MDYNLAHIYAEKHAFDLPEYINTIYKQSVLVHPHAHLSSSTLQAKFLHLLIQLLQPKHVLEVGTFVGFTTVCMAEALTDDGEIHTIEIREEDAVEAQKNFSISPKNNKIHLHLGDARNIIANLNLTWDFIFLDADKVSYVEYYEALLPKMSKNGVIIADNVLFHGQVFEQELKGKNAKAIDAFNKHVANDDRVIQTILPFRDGLMMMKKK